MAQEERSPKTNPQLVFGKLVVKYGFATTEVVRQALESQKAQALIGKKKPLGEILVEMGAISPSQMKAVLRLQKFFLNREQEKPLLEYAVTKGYLLPRDEKRVLARQTELFKLEKKVYPIEQILYEENILDDSAIQALKDAFSEERTPQPEHKRPVCAQPEPQTRPDSSVPPERLSVLEEIFDITVSSDRLLASLVWSQRPPRDLTVQELEAFLSRRGLCGVFPASELLTQITSQRTVKGALVVARGRPPVPGRDASIHYHFDADPLKIGRIKKGGSIDFRDRGEIPLVREGDLLAEKIPPKPGSPGIDVFGLPIDPPKPADLILRCGRGAVRSDDGRQVIAIRAGRPQISADGKISVQSELEIHGDVDLKTGHVIFDGDVKISGAITAGFRVKAVTVSASEIYGGEIQAEGDVVIMGGVISASIHTQGHVKAKHLAGSTVQASGDVAVSTSIVDSTIETSGSLLAPTASVLSSNITAANKIHVLHVGSEKSRACRLIVGEDPVLKRKLSLLRERMQRLKDWSQRLKNAEIRQRKALSALELAVGKKVQFQDKTLSKIRKLEEQEAKDSEKAAILAQIETLRKEVTEADQEVERLFRAQDAVKASLLRLVERRTQCARDLADLEEEVRGLLQWSKMKQDRPEVVVRGVIAPGTIVIGTESSWKAVEQLQAVRIVEKSVEDPHTGLWKKKIILSGLS